MKKLIYLIIFFQILLFGFVGSNAQSLIDFDRVLSKEYLGPLVFINNEDYVLLPHPFNKAAYWLVNNKYFDPNLDSVIEYGVSISIQPKEDWENYFKIFSTLEGLEVYKKHSYSDRCLIRLSSSDGQYDYIAVLLEIEGVHYSISGRRDFIIANIDLQLCLEN